MKFCCKNFLEKHEDTHVSFYSDDRSTNPIVMYKPRVREYLISHSEEVGTHMEYCPYCGKKMPKTLWNEWYSILKKEYGIIDPLVDDEDKVPKEFWTDEWWKKRGL